MLRFKDPAGKRICLWLILFFVIAVVVQVCVDCNVLQKSLEIILNVPGRYTETFGDLLRYVGFFYHFDYLMIFGFFFFQILIIFIAPIGGALFCRRLKTIMNMEASRYPSKKKLITTKMLEYSAYVSLGTYIGFLIVFIAACFLCPVADDINGVQYRTLFCDWFGNDFYMNFRHAYWLLEGTVKYLFIPFVYSLFSCSLSFAVSKTYLVYFLPIVYWFGGTILGYFVHQIDPNIFQYYSPSFIMACSGEVVTILVFIPHLIILLLTYLLYRRAVTGYEG